MDKPVDAFCVFLLITNNAEYHCRLIERPFCLTLDLNRDSFAIVLCVLGADTERDDRGHGGGATGEGEKDCDVASAGACIGII